MTYSKYERDGDLRYMANPGVWVTFLCPLKRWNAEQGCNDVAYLIGDGPRLRIGNMFMARESDPIKVYDSFEAIYDDGWRVD